MKKFFSTQPVWYDGGLFVVRLILGLFMVYHGWEIFDDNKMNEYAGWDSFKNQSFMAYLGKGAELIGGAMMVFGWLTRLAALIIAGTMAYIAFFVGNGIIWYNDQHPFMFVVLALVFIFTGPGRYSVDALIHRKLH